MHGLGSISSEAHARSETAADLFGELGEELEARQPVAALALIIIFRHLRHVDVLRLRLRLVIGGEFFQLWRHQRHHRHRAAAVAGRQ